MFLMHMRFSQSWKFEEFVQIWDVRILHIVITINNLSTEWILSVDHYRSLYILKLRFCIQTGLNFLKISLR